MQLPNAQHIFLFKADRAAPYPPTGGGSYAATVIRQGQPLRTGKGADALERCPELAKAIKAARKA